MTDPLRTHVRKILQAMEADHAATAAKIREVEASGQRIIGGGQIGGGWEITDWRTGERLATGTTGYDEYCGALKRLDPDGHFWHIDHITDDLEWQQASPTEGVPPTLASALVEWVEYSTTPAEEIAQAAGWDVARVECCLAEVGPPKA